MAIKVQVAPGGGGVTSGEAETTSAIISGKEFAVGGPVTFEPEYVDSLELDVSGNTEVITDQCGYTEVRKMVTRIGHSRLKALSLMLNYRISRQ